MLESLSKTLNRANVGVIDQILEERAELMLESLTKTLRANVGSIDQNLVES